jgi:hypothetical protein
MQLIALCPLSARSLPIFYLAFITIFIMDKLEQLKKCLRLHRYYGEGQFVKNIKVLSKDSCLTCSIVRTHSICPAGTQLVLTTSSGDGERALAGNSLTTMVNVVNVVNRESESRNSAVSGLPRRRVRDLRE